MNKNEITKEGNHLLTQFMGSKDCDYDKDWNRLMEIYHKITYDIVGVKHPLNTHEEVLYFQQINTLWKKLNLALITPCIKGKEEHLFNVFLAIVEFIEWYNQNVKQTNNGK